MTLSNRNNSIINTRVYLVKEKLNEEDNTNHTMFSSHFDPFVCMRIMYKTAAGELHHAYAQSGDTRDSCKV